MLPGFIYNLEFATLTTCRFTTSKMSPTDLHFKEIMNDKKDIYLIAGEASGDLLAASLAKAIKIKLPTANLHGVGGQHMQQAGVTVEEDMSILSIVGVTEVVKDLGAILSLMHRVKKRLLQNKPDVLVLIDAPGFNLRIAKWAHKHGIRVLYLVSPQIWAWKSSRIKLIKKVVDFMAVILPFEVELYNKHDVPNMLVQHPLYLESKVEVEKAEIYQKFNLKPEQPILVVMPGSRSAELERHLPIINAAYQKLVIANQGLQCVCLKAPNKDISAYENKLDKRIKIIGGHNHEILTVATAAVVVSGTATLEVALHQVPMVTIYKMSSFTYRLARRVVKLPYISLCNCVLGDMVVPELIQEELQVDKLVAVAQSLMIDGSYRQDIVQKLLELQQKFAGAREMTNLVEDDVLF